MPIRKGLDRDVIYLYHHYPGDEIPKALAVLDPKTAINAVILIKNYQVVEWDLKLIHAYSRVHWYSVQ